MHYDAPDRPRASNFQPRFITPDGSALPEILPRLELRPWRTPDGQRLWRIRTFLPSPERTGAYIERTVDVPDIAWAITSELAAFREDPEAWLQRTFGYTYRRPSDRTARPTPSGPSLADLGLE